MKCKNCGADLPPTASYCDMCGARVIHVNTEVAEAPKKTARRRSPKLNITKKAAVIITIAASAIILVTVAILVASSTGRSNDAPESLYSDLSEVPYRVTPEMVQQMELGMTYDEIIAIIGGEGHTIYQYNDYITYRWPGELYNRDYDSDDVFMYSELSIDFRGDEKIAYSIDEEDIIDGQEIYTNKKEDRIAMTNLREEELTAVKEFMTYEEVREIMGTDGVLEGSSVYKHDYGETVERDYAWAYKKQYDNGSEYDSAIRVCFRNGKVSSVYY